MVSYVTWRTQHEYAIGRLSDNGIWHHPPHVAWENGASAARGRTRRRARGGEARGVGLGRWTTSTLATSRPPPAVEAPRMPEQLQSPVLSSPSFMSWASRAAGGRRAGPLAPGS